MNSQNSGARFFRYLILVLGLIYLMLRFAIWQGIVGGDRLYGMQHYGLQLAALWVLLMITLPIYLFLGDRLLFRASALVLVLSVDVIEHVASDYLS